MVSSRYAGLILARGGSVGIPRKNARLIAGTPLVQRAVRTLSACGSIPWVAVSTDDDEIANLARTAGAEAIRRPDSLAASDSSALSGVEHAVSEILASGRSPDLVVLFQATSPLVTSADIDRACELFEASDAVYGKSVTAVRERPEWMAQVVEGRLRYRVPASERERPRQCLPHWVRLNGAISIFRTSAIVAGRAMEGDPLAFELPPERSVDLDDEWDWTLAEWCIERGKAPSDTAHPDTAHPDTAHPDTCAP